MYQLNHKEIKKQFPLDNCHELSMFGALSNDSLSFLLDKGTVLSYSPKEVIFHSGELSDSFYIILKGKLSYFRYQDGSKFYIRSFITGEEIGYVTMIGLHERRGDAVVDEESIVLKVTSELFHQVCEKFSHDFVIFLINMTRDMSREITDLEIISINNNLLTTNSH